MGPRLGILFVMSLLGACAQTPGENAAALAGALEISRANLAANTPGGLLPAAPQPAPRPRTPATRPRPSDEAPGTRPANTAQLLGAAPEMLRRWLGEPALRRPEGGAEIWLYASQDCALDLVLYREAGALRVAHAAARANGAAAQTEGACLRQISAAAAARPVPAASEATPTSQREPGV
jgi:hypothetical protein